MSWLDSERVPEPEVMDAESEVEAYASATAQNYLETIDKTFVEHLARLLPAGVPRGFRALDIGCGPGQIPILIARRWPQMHVTGIDAAAHMIEEARRAAQSAGVKVDFEVLRILPGAAHTPLPFADGSFDAVTCNSVVHHLADPLSAFNEMARVVRPGGAVLVRDLRRPSALALPWHIRWNGRHYSGQMRRLYEASVRAAYTKKELQVMLEGSTLNDGNTSVFAHRRTHIGIERPTRRL